MFYTCCSLYSHNNYGKTSNLQAIRPSVTDWSIYNVGFPHVDEFITPLFGAEGQPQLNEFITSNSEAKGQPQVDVFINVSFRASDFWHPFQIIKRQISDKEEKESNIEWQKARPAA